MTYEQLEQKIKSMTAKEIILAMIDSLKNPVTKIEMSTFGYKERGICYGCAATNTICKLGDLDPHIELGEYDLFQGRGYVMYNKDGFLDNFENAIDFLRQGDIESYNDIADSFQFAKINRAKYYYIPVITDNNYLDKNVLNAYIGLANLQE